MNQFIPIVDIEFQGVSGETVIRRLRHDARAQRHFDEYNQKHPLKSSTDFEVLPRLIWALTRHEGSKEETPEYFEEFIGAANVEYFNEKLDEATGGLLGRMREKREAAANPQQAKVNGVAPLIGGDSKPSPVPNSD